ncbi:hypothetical protein HJFPF1_03976 [Paramyrothecium foliicola]|nr:hypothetical protein HJFPF1_03976 [Paramyrothecium foliicola]
MERAQRRAETRMVAGFSTPNRSENDLGTRFGPKLLQYGLRCLRRGGSKNSKKSIFEAKSGWVPIC